MKRIEYSPDYKEKIEEIRKYLDFQFGDRTREKIMRELDTKIHSCRYMRIWGFLSEIIMVWIVITCVYMQFGITSFTG